MKTRRRIIGCDPGTKICGVAVADYDSDSGQNLTLLECSTIQVEGSKAFRLNWLYERLSEFFKKWGTERLDVCLERAWIGNNPQTAIVIGESRGVILAAAGGIRRARFFDYMTPQVRKSLGLGRNGDKYQTALIVKAVLRIPPDVELPLDATDAAAILVHHYSQGNKLHPFERE